MLVGGADPPGERDVLALALDLAFKALDFGGLTAPILDQPEERTRDNRRDHPRRGLQRDGRVHAPKSRKLE